MKALLRELQRQRAAQRMPAAPAVLMPRRWRWPCTCCYERNTKPPPNPAPRRRRVPRAQMASLTKRYVFILPCQASPSEKKWARALCFGKMQEVCSPTPMEPWLRLADVLGFAAPTDAAAYFPAFKPRRGQSTPRFVALFRGCSLLADLSSFEFEGNLLGRNMDNFRGRRNMDNFQGGGGLLSTCGALIVAGAEPMAARCCLGRRTWQV